MFILYMIFNTCIIFGLLYILQISDGQEVFPQPQTARLLNASIRLLLAPSTRL